LAIPAGAWSPSRSPVCSPTRIKAIPGITDVATDQLNGGPMLDITIKREVASSYGIMPYAIEVEKELGKPLSLETSFQGNAQAFGASLSSTPILIAAALFVIYLVLGVLHESLIHPITIISTLPSAGLGALLLLMAIHCDLSVIAIVGVILLIGIVKKNGIMLVDFAQQAEHNEGKTAEESIYPGCFGGTDLGPEIVRA
jgi:multidrug efflux pump subunit AcrB